MSKHKVPYTEATAANILDQILSDAGDVHVVVGPLCTNPPPSWVDKRSYFNIATGGAQQEFRCDLVYANAASRRGIITTLARRKPLVVTVVEDELEMAKVCEALWPGEVVTRLREAVEAERRSGEPRPGFH